MTQLEELEKTKEELNRALALVSKLESEHAECSELRLQLRALQDINEDLRRACAEAETQVAQLRAENERLKKQIADPALQIVNAGGEATPANTVEAAPKKAREELLAEYSALKDAKARAEFRERYAEEFGLKKFLTK